MERKLKMTNFNTEKHFNHPFYKNARNEWIKMQDEQILKGSEKYPEPFTPSSWSNEQLAEHAIQENVDQLHYIVGMKERMEQQEKEIERLNKENENQLHYINSARKDYTKAVETIDELRKEIRQVNEDAIKIESVADFNADECQRLRESEARLMNENETLEKVKNSQIAKILDLKREVERLEKETVFLQNVRESQGRLLVKMRDMVNDLKVENSKLRGGID